MNRIELIRMLRGHIKLAEKRSAAYEQNRTAKVVMYVMSGFMIVYLIFLAILFAMIANDSASTTPYEFLYSLAPFILCVDLLFRFMAQQTPAQLIKPYILQPIPKHACVESFIVTAMINPNNFLWMFMFIPYAIMSVVFSVGFWSTIGFLCGWMLLIIMNSLWYMLVRTLINDRIWWWVLPVIVYAAVFAPWYLSKFSTFADFYGSIGEGVTFWNPITFLLLIAILLALFFINRSVQFHYVYAELAAIEKTKLHNVSQFRYLERFGEVGEYLKLEVKSIMRNKNMRKQFIFSVAIVTVFSLLLSFTDIYDDSYNSNFLAFYNFAIFGLMGLSRVMCAEGNYIDGLMVHKENIISLLKAKYYFYVVMLVLPFLLMIPTIVQEKCTWLMLTSIFFFTAGAEYCLLMHMAIWNKQTVPLNEKFVSKGSVETNYFQIIINLAVLFVPVITVMVLLSMFNATTAYLILLVLGLILMATNSLWIRFIYRHFMRHRYDNMESFRATR